VPLTCGPGLVADEGVGTGRRVAAAAGLGRDDVFDGRPPGPPGRSNFPLVMGLAIALARGVGLDTELGGSPGPT